MLRNYLTVALRNLFRQKVYSFVNIAGLAIGIATCVLILSFVRFELSYDTYHEKADRIYRVAQERIAADGQVLSTAFSQQPLAPALRAEFPEVVQAVRFVRGGTVISHENNRFYEEFLFGDASALEVFDFPLIKGDRHTALQAPYSVVLTEKMARKYFGTKDPMGKVLTFTTPVVQHHYTVTGLYRKFRAILILDSIFWLRMRVFMRTGQVLFCRIGCQIRCFIPMWFFRRDIRPGA